jgi:protein subunit release factor A
MTKIRARFFFEQDVLKHAETNPNIVSFSDWACEQYYKEFMSKEFIVKKLNQKYKECEQLENQLKIIKQKNNSINILNKQEIEWIKNNIPKNIKKLNMTLTYKKFKYCVNSCLTKRQFMLALKEVENDKENNG